jgi:hypothetical protein
MYSKIINNMGKGPEIGSPALYADNALPAHVFISVLLAQKSLKTCCTPLPHFEVLCS